MRNSLRARPTFEAAIDAMVEIIEQTGLRPDDRLGTEASLASTLGISKPTLRQALRVLERSGVIETRRGSAGGVFVVAEMIPPEALSGGVAREEAAVSELLHARRLLEPIIYELAATAATDDDIAEIQRSIELGWRHLNSNSLVLRADAMFHRAMARACHNSVLIRAITAVYRDLAPVREGFWEGTPNAARHLLEVHQRQLDAIRRRDVSALRAALDETLVTLEDEFARFATGVEHVSTE